MADAETKSDIDIFFSPEAIVMFPVAIILDLVGIVLVCFGLDDFFITDITAVFTIGFWMLFRSQTRTKPAGQKVEMPEFGGKRELAKGVKTTREAAKAAKAAEEAAKAAEVAAKTAEEATKVAGETAKATKKATKAAKWGKRLKWVRPLCFLGEFITWIGAIPFLTVATYLELKYNS